MGPFDIVLPTLPHLHAEVTARAAHWPAAPRLLISEADKFAAYRTARAALVASGTATLEVALSGVPLIGAYKVSRLEEPLKHFISAPSILLPNLILEERAIPEFLQHDCTPGPLALAMAGLLTDSPERGRNLEALAGSTPRCACPATSGRAARPRARRWRPLDRPADFAGASERRRAYCGFRPVIGRGSAAPGASDRPMFRGSKHES